MSDLTEINARYIYFSSSLLSYTSRQKELEEPSQNSSFGIATPYEMARLWFVTRYEATYLAIIHTGPGVNPNSCTIGNGSLSRGKGSVCDIDRPPQRVTRLQED